jgi:four helix bundle protein
MRLADLRVLQESFDLSIEIYRLTSSYPVEEKFGLALQMRRASASIGANIAEGWGRWSPRDQARFYEISKGSAEELRFYITLSARLGFLKADPALDKAVDVICGGIFKLRKSALERAKKGGTSSASASGS